LFCHSVDPWKRSESREPSELSDSSDDRESSGLSDSACLSSECDSVGPGALEYDRPR
jgi:hypothetical protein